MQALDPLSLSSTDRVLHEQALQAAENFRRAESEAINILQQVEERKIHLTLGFACLFEYAIEALRLSEANAYAFVSKARRIIPVLTKENSTEWIEKTISMSKNDLEREVARVAPETVQRESVRVITEDRVRVKVDISQQALQRLRRAQSVLANKRRRPINLEEVLAEVVEEYLRRNDPREKKASSSHPINSSRDLAGKPEDQHLDPLGFIDLAGYTRGATKLL